VVSTLANTATETAVDQAAIGEGTLAVVSPLAAPRLSVVVCTYQRYDVLTDALASLLMQDGPTGFLEVIVIDNSPDQKAAAEFGTRYAKEPSIRYLLEPTPGLSNARNVGIGQAKADLVAFIDDDALAAPNWACEILRAFELHGERAGVVGGRVIPHWVKPKPPWLSDSLLSHLSIIDWGDDMRELKPAEWLVGCNIAFRKSTLVSVGGFSRALGRIGSGLTLLSNDEIEVLEKIHAAGQVSIYAPNAIVQHVIDPERLKRAWFHRRVAWQAVSDFIKDSEKAAAHASALADRLHLRLRLARRVLRGAHKATDDADQFERDVWLTYDLVISMLSGGTDKDVWERPARSRLIKAAARMRRLLKRQPPGRGRGRLNRLLWLSR
jgi:glucosyl-dolichyl phosphate glucuronosyltransferase